jgi:hypothetical protein
VVRAAAKFSLPIAKANLERISRQSASDKHQGGELEADDRMSRRAVQAIGQSGSEIGRQCVAPVFDAGREVGFEDSANSGPQSLHSTITAIEDLE